MREIFTRRRLIALLPPIAGLAVFGARAAAAAPEIPATASPPLPAGRTPRDRFWSLTDKVRDVLRESPNGWALLPGGVGPIQVESYLAHHSALKIWRLTVFGKDARGHHMSVWYRVGPAEDLLRSPVHKHETIISRYPDGSALALSTVQTEAHPAASA